MGRWDRVVTHAVEVRSHFDMLIWLQGDMQLYLPHDIMLTAWGDFDGDHDLDFIVTGMTSAGAWNTRWYENTATDRGRANMDPPAPIALSSLYDPARGGYVFSWQAPGIHVDETAESAFGYEIRVGMGAGC